MTFGEKLLRLTSDRGWSQTYVISQIGQHAPTWHRWLSGAGHPNPKDLRELARVFLVDIDWLIDDTRGWDDRPSTGSQTWALAQVLEIAGKIGPDEALRRLKAPVQLRAMEDEGDLINPNPQDGAGPKRPKRKSS